MHHLLALARGGQVLLKTDDRVLQHGEHEHPFGIQIETPLVSRLKLSVDEDVRLKYRHGSFCNRDAGLLQSRQPKRRPAAIVRCLRFDPLLYDHDITSELLDKPFTCIVPLFLSALVLKLHVAGWREDARTPGQENNASQSVAYPSAGRPYG